MIELKELLTTLLRQDVSLWVEDEKLHYRIPPGLASGEIVEKLRAHKAQIIDLLKRSRQTSKTPSLSPRSSAQPTPLSYAQERLWFLDQLHGANSAYNIYQSLRIEGRLDERALVLAFTELVRMHPALRTRFPVVGGQPVQVVDPPDPFSMTRLDLCDLEEGEQGVRLQSLIARESARTFDLAAGPLFRVLLLVLTPSDHVLVMCVHHIVSDGWSMSLIRRDFSHLYHAFVSGTPLPGEPPKLQYTDYALWQREWLQGEFLEEQLRFWRNQLADLQVLQLPMDRPRPAVQSFNGAALPFSLSPSLSRKLTELARDWGATMHMVLLAAFQLLLGRYSGQKDIAIGVPVAGRSLPELENLVGFFVNTVVLRTDLSGALTFRTLCEQVKNSTLAAHAHEHVPFEKLVAELQPGRDLSRQPLIQVLFGWNNLPSEVLDLPKLSWQPVGGEHLTAKFDLSLYMHENAGVLEGSFEYATDLFEAATIERMADHFRTLLISAVANPEQRVAELPLLDGKEREQLLVKWNDTAHEYPREQCLHELFEAQVAKTPNALALVHGDEQISYVELNSRANQLAKQLCARGVKPETVVGLCMERGVPMIVGILGILKSGAAYLPLDPEYPSQRLAYMVRGAGVRFLVTQRRLAARAAEPDMQVICIEEAVAAAAGVPAPNPGIAVSAENLAYVIYTSGSTGQPKGIGLQHSAVGLCAWARQMYGDADLKAVAAGTSICFDLSIFEIFVPLCCGGKVVVADSPVQLPGNAHELTLLNTVPSAIAELLRQGLIPHSVRVINIAGEPLRASLVEQLYRETSVERVYNLYGPSETTTYSTCAWVRAGAQAEPSIGRPISNTRLYVLDERLEPVPIGVIGELYIGGEGLARGYLNRAGMTAQRFVADPFSEAGGERLYRTGDRVRYLADGNVEFVGRIDEQVKLRGYRIELGEIESVLLEQPGVKQAVVVLREDVGGDPRLVGYVSGKQQLALSGQELRTALSSRLPQYMLPAALVVVEEFPLTRSGKIDRQALPAPEWQTQLARPHETARTPIEAALVQIWSQILSVRAVGIHDNFFELGGHSLLATRVVAQVREVLGVELPVRLLFEEPSIAQLAVQVERLQRTGSGLSAPALTVQTRSAALPLSYPQERLWFLEQLGLVGSAYNMSCALYLQGSLQIEVLQRALSELIRRHESLRTRIVQDQQGLPVQVIDAPSAIELAIEDFSQLAQPRRDEQLEERLQQLRMQRMDLTSGPLIRAHVLNRAAHEHVLLLTIHHVVCDGWSMGVLIRELNVLYAAYWQGQAPQLVPLPIQYADYAIWQRQWLQGEVLAQQLAYWRDRLAGIETLQLPTDRVRPAVPSFQGAAVSFTLPAELYAKLTALSQQQAVTLYMVLLAALQAMLARYSGQTDIAVGSPIAGRGYRQTEGLIGLFLNTLVLRTDVSGDPSFAELLQRVKQVTLGAYAHQDLPFEKLVAELQPDRDLSRQALFQVMCALQNFPREQLDLPGLSWSVVPAETVAAKFDLVARFVETSTEIVARFEYAVDLFEHATIERMASHFVQLLTAAVADPHAPLGSLEIFAARQQELLASWSGTRGEYPREHCIHELFAEQAARTPDATALVWRDQHVTYRELDQRANRFAWQLRNLGVGPERIVGLCAERGIEMVVGLLAILKAGGAYLPLDVTHPVERLRQVANNAQADVLLTTGALIEKLSVLGARSIRLDEHAGVPEPRSDHLPPSHVHPDNLAYLIYTSGSTGKPKGVAASHRGAVNYLADLQRRLRLAHHDRVLQVAPITFDAALRDLMGTLFSGATVVLLEPEAAQDPKLLIRVAADQRVTQILAVTPSRLETLLACGEPVHTVRRVLVAGEALHWSTWRRLRQMFAPDVEVVNLYGPTEAVLTSTIYRVAGDDGSNADNAEGIIPLGRPIDNRRLYVLDSDLRPVDIGIPGEAWISGEGITRGYWGSPGLTAQRFVADPFAVGERMYRTGDRVRQRNDGNLQFLGRLDHQIKLRGFRIELGEIEAVLMEHEDVARAAVVLADDSSNGQRLLAYVVAKKDRTVDVSRLRRYSRNQLPDYMVPAAFMVLDALPLNVNGKLDRKSLPRLDVAEQFKEHYEPPQTRVQNAIAEIWSQLLDAGRIGVRDNFFELGGHSLLAMRAAARLRQQLHIEVPVRVLFEMPTVESLAEYIENVLWIREQVR